MTYINFPCCNTTIRVWREGDSVGIDNEDFGYTVINKEMVYIWDNKCETSMRFRITDIDWDKPINDKKEGVF